MNTYLRLIALLLVGNAAASAAEFVWIDDQAAPAPIVVYADAPPRTRDAAVTLADYVERISGVRPTLIDGEPRPLPERAVWVGMQPAVKALFPGVETEFKHPEEILLAANEKHLLIAGRDRWIDGHLDAKGEKGTVTGKQLEYGTANAVFTFLQDQLGVRWLWPGPLGEDVPRQKSLRIAAFTHRFHPPIRGRGGLIHYSQLGEAGYGRSHDWTRLQRLQLSSLSVEGGHGFGTWWDRYGTTHPEYFALQPDGTRGGYPNPRTVKLCHSNPEVARQWLADVEAKLAEDPSLTVFNASPNDGWASGHCTCENCRAWDQPDAEKRLFHWQNRHELHPALTDRDVTFANVCGKLLKERFPDKDYYVLMLSYGHSRPAPRKAKPAENVIMSSVANFLGRTNLIDDGSTTDTTHREQFVAWTKVTPRLFWRPNTGSPAGWQQGLPDVSIAQTIKDFELVGRSGCLGIYIDAVWEHWATHGPMYYVMAQMTWNPQVDGRAVLDDYYRRGFGPAAEPVRAYYETFERARMAYVDKHGYDGGMQNYVALYTPELLAEAASHLDRAAKAVAKDDLYRRRVEFVDVGLQYTRLVVDTMRLMLDYWKEKDAAIEARVRKNWEAIEQLCTANAPAINWGPVRPQTPRMAGLHPDFPAVKTKKKSRSKAPNDLDLN